MTRLAEAFGGSAYLGICDGLEMVVIEACRARTSMVTLRLDVGSRLPIATSALGRAYLSALPEPERAPLLDKLKHKSEADWPRLVNIPLGTHPQAQYEQTSVEMHPGDVFVFYSDGFTEAVGEDV